MDLHKKYSINEWYNKEKFLILQVYDAESKKYGFLFES